MNLDLILQTNWPCLVMLYLLQLLMQKFSSSCFSLFEIESDLIRTQKSSVQFVCVFRLSLTFVRWECGAVCTDTQHTEE